MTDSPTDPALPPSAEPIADSGDQCLRLHLVVGWWSLLVFVVLGVVLEGMHAFKVGWYLDVGNDSRRLTWRLAHAHGTFLGLVNIAFAATLLLAPDWIGTGRRVASRGLLASTILIPGGFFLGGIWIYDGDPGLGVFLVPAGAVLLVIAAFLTAQGVRGPEK